MKEKGRDILKKAIQELPEYTFNSEDIWMKIDNSLNAKQASLNTKLPEYSLPKDIWPAIEQGLDNNRKKKIYLSAFRVAAVITILLGSGLILKEYFKNNAESSTISYSTETIEDQSFFENTPQIEIQKNEHIQVICQNNPQACTSPVFIELNKQINDISSEMKKISKIIKKNNDPQILRYYYRLENKKVEIELQMLKLINQS